MEPRVSCTPGEAWQTPGLGPHDAGYDAHLPWINLLTCMRYLFVEVISNVTVLTDACFETAKLWTGMDYRRSLRNGYTVYRQL